MSKRSIVHFEIPSAGRESAAQFYSEAFGWTFEHLSHPSPYTMVETGSVAGGFVDVGELYQVGNVVLYLGSDDVEADLKKIESLGGKRLSSPFKVGDFGEMAFFADPSGNRLALWKALDR
jgi:uncharacterized protein